MKLSDLFHKPTKRQKVLKKYLKEAWGVTPKDYTLYEQALRHKSVVGSGKFCHTDCNERLELLGDAVLDTVVTEYLFYQFPEANEGKLTKLRARIVSRQSLSEVGLKAKLDQMLETRISHEDSNLKIVGNALEAWLGAIYLDRGFEVAKNSVSNFLLNRYIDLNHVSKNAVDFKSQIIEWAQQNRRTYQFKTSPSANDNLEFTCEFILDGAAKSVSTERSKKKAEQKAAKLAIVELGIHV